MKRSKMISAARFVAVWLPTVLLGSLFVMQGLMKVSGLPMWIERFDQWGYPAGFCQVVGAVELLGGLALFVPAVAGFAATGLAVVMLGAAGTHLMQGELPNVAFTAILMLIFLGLARVRLPRFKVWRDARSA